VTYTENSQTWFRRQRTSKKHSLKSRLVIRVSVVLLIAWVVGVVYAKCFSYHQNRALLVDQSEELSNTLLSVSQRKVGNAISNSQLFYSWKNGEPVFELGSLARRYIWWFIAHVGCHYGGALLCNRLRT